jgi:hypothetical protein
MKIFVVIRTSSFRKKKGGRSRPWERLSSESAQRLENWKLARAFL